MSRFTIWESFERTVNYSVSRIVNVLLLSSCVGVVEILVRYSRGATSLQVRVHYNHVTHGARASGCGQGPTGVKPAFPALVELWLSVAMSCLPRSGAVAKSLSRFQTAARCLGLPNPWRNSTLSALQRVSLCSHLVLIRLLSSELGSSSILYSLENAGKWKILCHRNA